MVKKVPTLNHEFFFVAILRSKPNLYIIMEGPNQMKVVILTQKCHERVLKLGTFDVRTEKPSKSLLKQPFSGSKFSMSRG